MKNTYFDLIEQSFKFPQEGFSLEDGILCFHGISLKKLIEEYGTPFRMMYLPHIGQQIRKAKELFAKAMTANDYKGQYHYCYCTKCNHFAPIIKTALKEDIHIETSSAYDIDLVLQLYKDGDITKETILIHNGYKTDSYLDKIIRLHKEGFENVLVVLDSKKELKRLQAKMSSQEKAIKIGIRMAVNEEAQFNYYTSRLGIAPKEIVNFYRQEIKGNPLVDFKMLHFFVDSGIKDTFFYWGEFQKALKLFAELKKDCDSLDTFNLGGGFPIRNSLGFEYDFSYIINEVVKNLKVLCVNENIAEPDIFTEFGKYTVGESGATIFSVLEQKQQNDTELWYMIDNSLINTIPDSWSIFEKFILLPINKWSNEYTRVNIGGLSCDHSDYYNSEDLNQQILLPRYNNEDQEPLYIGFFHTGAYQDAISGYGGIKHCLIPAPKYILVDKEQDGKLSYTIYKEEQSVESMLNILGFS